MLLVVPAFATGAAGLAWWLIALVELAAWAAVTLAERTLWRLSLASPPAWVARADAPSVPAEPESADPPPEAETEGALPAAPVGFRRMIPTPSSAKPAGDHTRWNVWSL